MATKSTIVLCEDETHQLFVYRWLLAKGIKAHEIRNVSLPAGKKAGSQHVLSRYATEINEYRHRANHVASRRLIVVLDGDVSGVATRMTQLDRQLADAHLTPRDAAERVCILIPCRNGETWVHFFHGHLVDETSDYKPLYGGDTKASACNLAGRAFESWLRSPPTQGSPSSLLASRSEAQRLWAVE